MKTVLLAILFAVMGWSQDSEIISLNGVKASVVVHSTRSDGSPSAGEMVGSPIVLPFAYGNQIPLKQFFWVGRSGSIVLLSSPGDIVWIRENGDQVPLNCRKHGTYRHRLVSFHEQTQVYKMGCHLSERTSVEINGGYVDVEFASAIDMNHNGSLSYVSRVGENQKVNLPFHPQLKIRNRSSLSFFANGHPRFLSIHWEESVEVKRPGRESLWVSTPEGLTSYTYFYENGMLQKGHVSRPLVVSLPGGAELEIAAGEPIGVHENGQLGFLPVKTGGVQMFSEDAMGEKMELMDGSLICLKPDGTLDRTSRICREKF